MATDVEKNNDAKRNQFTETLVAKLYAHTVAALIVESGDIQGNQNATQRTQGALGLASKIGEISGIPLYSHVCDFAKHSISGIDNTSQTGQRKNITSSFDSYSQQDQLIHKTAA